MKKEKIKILVTVEIGYTTNAKRKEMIRAAKEYTLSASVGSGNYYTKPLRSRLYKGKTKK